MRAKSKMPTGEFAAGAGFEIFLKGSGFGFGGKANSGFDAPRFEFGGVRAPSFVVFLEASWEVGGDADIMTGGIGLADQDVDVKMVIHSGLPSRSLAAEQNARLRHPRMDSGVVAFALRCAASEGWWRRGDSNPRPNKSHNSFYARSHTLKDSPPPLPYDRATSAARILLNLAPPSGSPILVPACYRRLYPLTGIRVETWRNYAASA